MASNESEPVPTSEVDDDVSDCSVVEFTDEEKNTVVYKITEKMAYYPVSVCTCIFSIILLMVVATVAGGLATISEATQYDWTIASSDESKNADAFDNAISLVDQLVAVSGERREAYENSVFYLFESKDSSDLYTPMNLQQMCWVESTLVLDQDFPNFCQLDEAGECLLSSSSIVVYFYDFTSLGQWNCSLLPQSVVDDRADELLTLAQTPAGQVQYGTWLDKGALDRGYSVKCNSAWSLGAPLAGYTSPTDDEIGQLEEYTKFLTKRQAVGGVEETLFEYFDIDTNADNFLPYYPSGYLSTAESGNMQTWWWCYVLDINEGTRLVSSDLVFAMFSILFVLFWLRVHTGSSFVALLAMFMIFCSIPVSLLLYKGIYGIPYFAELHILVLFIVLGIGADDVFVLVDSWKQTAQIYPGDLTDNLTLTHRRLFYCYKHTMETVFNTSFTTAMAFIATGFSPLMPIATFGWFAATCIVMNYVFVITLMPAVVVVAEKYTNTCCGLCDSGSPAKGAPTAVPLTEEGTGLEKREGDGSDKGGTVEMVEREQGGDVEEKGEEGGDRSGGSNDLAIVSTHSSPPHSEAVTLGAEVANETPAPNPVPSKNYRKEGPPAANNHINGADIKAGPAVELYIRCMTTKVDLPGPGGRTWSLPVVALTVFCSLFAFGVVGIVEGLKLEPPTEQERWFPLKHMFTEATDSLQNDFLGFDETSYDTISFFFGISGIDRGNFNIYKPGGDRGDAVYDENWNLAQPSCQRVMVRMCEDIPTFRCSKDVCEPTRLMAIDSTTECFMTSFRSWTNETYGLDTYALNETRFYDLLMTFRATQNQQTDDALNYQDIIGFIDGDLKFASVYFTSTLEILDPLQDKLDYHGVLRDFRSHVRGYEECRGSDGCDCSSLKFVGTGTFQWMRSEEGVVNGFYQGLYIAFPVSFCVLLFATANLIISVYAILSVFFIVFGVLGFVNYGLMWNLGIAESIAGIIIIGFSVDYTVHLGHMFTYGEHVGLHSREDKFEFCSRKIVATIVGGAITTLGAGVFMFACQLTFFTKMATLIVCTIVMSFVYALGFFMSLLFLFGPEGKVGNFKYMASHVMGMANWKVGAASNEKI